MSLCGQWVKEGKKYTGHRYGICICLGETGPDTHCPHICGDDDEWCCRCVLSIVLERDLEAYDRAGYPKFEEDAWPLVLDDNFGFDNGITVDTAENTRAKSRQSILDSSAIMLAAWLGEVESRSGGVVQSKSERV